MDSVSISAIIIDDEPDAINLLEMYLRQFPFIKVVGKENQAAKGLQLVNEILPELVFLDIDMPDMNGLQVADKIHSDNFYSEIVFTTAHQHYAYDTLGVEPLDFLTKPFCISDLEIVIEKFRQKTEKKKQERKLDTFIHSQANSPKIKLPSTTGILIIDLKDIVILKSKANNCNIFLQDGTTETITRNLYKVAEILNSQAFFQTKRSTYINLNYLKRVDKKKLMCTITYNQTTVEVPISRHQMILLDKYNLFQMV
ncbi:MAG: LytTR family DNA-binding domain-containing protein [Prolixibacteraceae bacterium]|jgi:DNA-binding LytR/AlgR family response regulator